MPKKRTTVTKTIKFIKKVRKGPPKRRDPKQVLKVICGMFGSSKRRRDSYKKRKKIIRPAKAAKTAKSATPTYTKQVSKEERRKWQEISKRGANILRTQEYIRKLQPRGIPPNVKLSEQMVDYLKVGRKGPFDLLEIELSSFGRSQLKHWKKMLGRSRYQQILQFLAIELRNIRRDLAYYGADEIKRYVPKDVGNLHISLRRSLSETQSIVPRGIPTPSNLKLRMGFNSELEYAEIVNKMPNKSLRHYGHTKSWRTGKMLYDPTATTHFMSLIRLHLKTRAKRLVINMIRNMTPNLGLSYNYCKKMFKIKHVGRY